LSLKVPRFSSLGFDCSGFLRQVSGVAIERGEGMSESIICERSFEFASRLLKLSERLWDRGPAARHIASQLMRCGTSVGSNAEEAQEAQSRADYIAKMNISRKEARETHWWLRLARKNDILMEKEMSWELSEASQLLAMIRSAVLTAKSRLKKHAKARE
jgi:four helix bundle protein